MHAFAENDVYPGIVLTAVGDLGGDGWPWGDGSLAFDLSDK
jgi:hypothetical protein